MPFGLYNAPDLAVFLTDSLSLSSAWAGRGAEEPHGGPEGHPGADDPEA